MSKAERILSKGWNGGYDALLQLWTENPPLLLQSLPDVSKQEPTALSDMVALFFSGWPWLAVAVVVVIDTWASVHVLLTKRDPRAGSFWIGLIWFVPILGGLLYYLLGINRIQRRARRLRRHHSRRNRAKHHVAALAVNLAKFSDLDLAHLESLVRLTDHVTGHPLVEGNLIEPLQNGERAYPAMLQAIDEAKQSVSLSTYIFDNDRIGERFVDALQRAVARRVEVRVLIDDIGAHYSWPTVVGPLRGGGVTVATFMPRFAPLYFPHANLRNHRKTLVIDGRIGFTGGMNIRAAHDLSVPARDPIQDLHFRIEGLVVSQLQAVFADDWSFSTGENLKGNHWFPNLGSHGRVLARGIASGPDDNIDKMRLTYLGALSSARTSVRIVTPYFLPDADLIAALNVAALRGIQVDIILPERNNLPFVQWASTAMLAQMLEHGCRLWLTPPPFDHTKLFLVDGVWTLLGSANWDPRSLRLNFELDLECYDRALAGSMEELVQQKLQRALPVKLADVDGRRLPVKLRDGIAFLFTPYL